MEAFQSSARSQVLSQCPSNVAGQRHCTWTGPVFFQELKPVPCTSVTSWLFCSTWSVDEIHNVATLPTPPPPQITRLPGIFPNRPYLLDQISSDVNSCPNPALTAECSGITTVAQQPKSFPYLWLPLLSPLAPATVTNLSYNT